MDGENDEKEMGGEEMTAVEDEVQNVQDDLVQAARYGDTDDLRLALSDGATVNTPDSEGRTALHMACANGHLDVVRLLIESHADVNVLNSEGSSPLHWAAVNGRIPIVELLMAHGANPAVLNRLERTPVDDALGAGHSKVLDVINTAMAAREMAGVAVKPKSDHTSMEEDGEGETKLDDSDIQELL
eukprot:TRINITY_DN3360_c0_g3_i1.p1 TRINITY_DN3360_c0_g3~~TRINITY_DN3360_c0_g3_i1.p1  ORF type:complete len:186 (+),score=41.10 TRINITY_DN3360_c0_g3_i1:478-1035(+)